MAKTTLDNPWGLTPTQLRRWMFRARGLTLRQIAEIEKVSHVSILESLVGANRRVKRLGHKDDGR